MKNLKKEFLNYIKGEIFGYEKQWNEYLEMNMVGDNYLFRENVQENLNYDIARLAYTCLDRGVSEKEVKQLFVEEGYEMAFLKAVDWFC